MIIDYCFGGDTYKELDVKNKIGNHRIKFAFEFDGKRYYFGRDLLNSQDIQVCDVEYNILQYINIKQFREFLFEKYNINLPWLENEQREFGIPVKVPKHFLQQYSAIERKISALESQNLAYEDSKEMVTEVKIAKQHLEQSETQMLFEIEGIINAQMVRYSDFIDETRIPPVLSFENNKKYIFRTPDDGGTGTSFKNVIVFDLSVLELTQLPAIVHDSLMFNHIGYKPLKRILELYMKS